MIATKSGYGHFYSYRTLWNLFVWISVLIPQLYLEQTLLAATRFAFAAILPFCLVCFEGKDILKYFVFLFHENVVRVWFKSTSWSCREGPWISIQYLSRDAVKLLLDLWNGKLNFPRNIDSCSILNSEVLWNFLTHFLRSYKKWKSLYIFCNYHANYSVWKSWTLSCETAFMICAYW